MHYDVVIVGGGPGGLSAALTLGRARKHVLLCDFGPRRNAAAHQIHNFVTRDGTPPEVFRQTARDQLKAYPNVEIQDNPVLAITGERDRFAVELPSGIVQARRILLCTGMIDELPEIEGFAALWGRSIFQCPYCHGWEVQDRPWAYLARPEAAPMLTHFVLQALAWTRDFVVFTGGSFELDADTRRTLERAAVRVETAPIERLLSRDGALAAIVLTDGTTVPREVLFAHPTQRQVSLVTSLGLALDEHGYVQVDPMRRETSLPGVYAGGDLASRMQGAIFAASAAVQAAAMINAELTAATILHGEGGS